MFFDGWAGVARILTIGIAAYAVVILWLRVSGKRTLTKWNAFDLVVTIALGSTVSTVMLSPTTTLVEGAAALGLLVALQFSITWLVIRLPAVGRLVKARPTLLLEDGRLIETALVRERVTPAEVLAAVRSAGFASLEDVGAVVLETDGSVSVIRRAGSRSRSAMDDVR